MGLITIVMTLLTPAMAVDSDAEANPNEKGDAERRTPSEFETGVGEIRA